MSSNNNNKHSSNEVKEGDRVEFTIGQNRLEGTVSEVLTSPHNVDGRVAHASKDEPRVAVHYDGTDRDIIRTMDTVEKKDDGSKQQGEVKEGDRVEFTIGQNKLEGTVSEVLTSPHSVDGRVAHASKDEPRVAVHYDGTGRDIIRTMDNVDKIEESSGSGRQHQRQEGEKSSSSSSGSQGGQSGQVHEGDRVEFSIGQNRLEGTVTEVLTSPHQIEGRIAHASKDEPRVAVQYDGTGREVIRTLGQIERIEESSEEREFRQGDRIAFHIGQNRLEGTIKEVLTSPREIDGRTAHASKDDPRYVIHYDGTNTDLIRTEEGVERMDNEGERMNTDSSGKRKRENDQDAGESEDKEKKKSSNKEPESKKQKNSSSGRSRKGTSAH